jgi:NAD(P)-dependent dehydrogenase (short-subunit alcohol dehydrogenase family)
VRAFIKRKEPFISTTDRREFSGKRVLVTGGAKGAGKAIADRFLRGRAALVISARSAPTEKMAAHFVQADVSTSAGTSMVIHVMLDRFGGADIIVHNVGGSSAPSGGFVTVTDGLWQQAINENLYPAVRLESRPAPVNDRTGLRRYHSHFIDPAYANSL